MSFASWLRSWKSAPAHTSSGRSRRRPASRLAVEQLEDRCLLAAGTLDPTFGTGGIVQTAFPRGLDDFLIDVAVNPDDHSLTVLGTSGADFVLARYNDSGNLTGGKATLADDAFQIALQSDGRVITLGSTGLARYSTAGVRDLLEFGDGGQAAIPFTPASLLVGPGNRIFVVGSSAGDFAVACFDANGHLDPTFDGDGLVTTDFGSPTDAAAAAAIDTQGRLLVVGSTLRQFSNNSDTRNFFALARYDLADGSLDTSFNGGQVTTDFGFGPAGSVSIGGEVISSIRGFGISATARSVAFQSDGGIIVAGTRNTTETGFEPPIVVFGGPPTPVIVPPGTIHDVAAIRYHENGTRDDTFGSSGLATVSGAFPGTVLDIAVQSDNSIVLASGGSLTRFGADGTPDSNFGGTGQVGNGFLWVTAVAFPADGPIVTAGNRSVWGSRRGSDFALARYDADGYLDVNNFGTGGFVTTDFPGGDVFDGLAAAVAVQADGKVVAGGFTLDSDGSVARVLARYNRDGSRDNSFDGDGLVLTGNITPPFFGDVWTPVAAVAVWGDKILVAGEVAHPDTGVDFGLARYNDRGSPDGFGTVSFDFAPSPDVLSYDRLFAMAVQPDGKILVAGMVQYFLDNWMDPFLVLARYNEDGSPDPGFNNGAPVMLPYNYDLGYGGQIALRTEGANVTAIVIAAGDHLFRFDGDGNPDADFGSGGQVISDFGPFSSVVFQPDGQLVVAGQGNFRYEEIRDGAASYIIPHADSLVARYDPDGSPDDSFGTEGLGLVTTDLGGYDQARGVALQPDGKILVLGSRTRYGGADVGYSIVGQDVALARYDSSGGLDSTFGSGGIFSLPGLSGALALQADGGIVVGGAFGTFALARVLSMSDPDGVDDTVEDGAPNNGDGNNDGTPDGQQAHVTSLANAVDGQYVTLASPTQTFLVGVTALPAPPAGQAPPEAEFPVGAFTFTVTGVGEGGTAEVILYMPPGTQVNAYFKHNAATNRWELFDGAQFEDRNGDGAPDVVLTLTDGGPGDDDGKVNGRIEDPGAPAFVPSVLRVQIDIRPEAINLQNQGVIPVVLFGSATFDVTQADVASIQFAGAAAFLWSLEDVNGDGHLDRVLHFRTQDTNLRPVYEQLLAEDVDADGLVDSTRQEAQVSLTGQTVNDLTFEGFDTVNLFLAGKALRDFLSDLAARGVI